MDIICIDSRNSLYLSSDIDDWPTITGLAISAVIDLDGGLDIGVPTTPDNLLYVYFPFDTFAEYLASLPGRGARAHADEAEHTIE